MRLLSKKQVREKVLYSPAHIARLEAAGSFAKRIRLGQGRVGWLEAEIAEYTLGKTQPRAKAWNTAVNRYLEEVEKRQKPRTYNDYKRFLAKHFRLGVVALVDIAPDDIETCIDRLSATPVEPLSRDDRHFVQGG